LKGPPRPLAKSREDYFASIAKIPAPGRTPASGPKGRLNKPRARKHRTKKKKKRKKNQQAGPNGHKKRREADKNGRIGGPFKAEKARKKNRYGGPTHPDAPTKSLLATRDKAGNRRGGITAKHSKSEVGARKNRRSTRFGWAGTPEKGPRGQAPMGYFPPLCKPGKHTK